MNDIRFVSQPYHGYFLNEDPAEDTELTHVGPGTPCGEYMRRFWHPVAMSSQLEDLPVAIRILGEDLVIFRDGLPVGTGRVALSRLQWGRVELSDQLRGDLVLDRNAIQLRQLRGRFAGGLLTLEHEP